MAYLILKFEHADLKFLIVKKSEAIFKRHTLRGGTESYILKPCN